MEAAFAGIATQFTNGNADFSKYTFVGREQVIKKATAYMSIFMYVIREMEDALDDCQKGLLQDNYNSVNAWDEAVAFYTGSIEGQDGLTPDGKLLHQLADKRCSDWKVCGMEGVDIEGMSKLNYDIFDLFTVGKFQVLSGNCPAARKTKEAIARKMYVPLIQGAMGYAYDVDMMQGGEGGRRGRRLRGRGPAPRSCRVPRGRQDHLRQLDGHGSQCRQECVRVRLPRPRYKLRQHWRVLE